ncbi:MAG TPA: hypothetical protein VN880_09000, partial [Solirubrobacteraceae bacterium]|nr:hypothetical protein [Solirubrobacteraceae bacterium]
TRHLLDEWGFALKSGPGHTNEPAEALNDRALLLLNGKKEDGHTESLSVGPLGLSVKSLPSCTCRAQWVQASRTV